MKHAKKIVSLFLTLVMCASFMSLSAFADLTLPSEDSINTVKNFNDYTATTGVSAPSATMTLLEGEALNYSTEGTLEAGARFSTTAITDQTLDATTTFFGKWEAEFILTPSQDIPVGAVTAYGQYANYSDEWVGISADEKIPANTPVRIIKNILDDGFKDMIADVIGKEQPGDLNGIPFAVVAYAVQTFNCGLEVNEFSLLAPDTTVELELRLYAPRDLSVAELQAVAAIPGLSIQLDSELGLYYVTGANGSWSKTFDLTLVGNYVARTGDRNYATLAEAIEAVPTNGTATIELLCDATEESLNSAAGQKYWRDITIDLGGHTLTLTKGGLVLANELTFTNGTVELGGQFTMYGNTTDADYTFSKLTVAADATLKATDYAVVFWGYEGSDGLVSYDAILDVYGEIQGNIFVSGNVHEGNSQINVYDGGKVWTGEGTTSTYGQAIAGNGSCEINVYDGATVIGKRTGIELRAGVLNVYGGTITGNGDEYVVNANGNGTTTSGAGVAVAQHTTKLPITATISGGEINGVMGLSVANPQDNETENMTVIVNGGQFTAVNSVSYDTDGKAVTNSDSRVSHFITGGYFSTQPNADYLAEGYITQVINSGTYNGYYQVLNGTPVAEVGGVQFVDLQDAIDAAKDGETVTLITNVVLNEQVEVTKKIKLDMGEFMISNTADIWDKNTGAWSLISVQGGDLTITGNGTMDAKENDCYALDIRDGGKLTIENGTFKGNVTAVYAYKGFATINGGDFYLKQLSSYNDYRYMLNCLDASYGSGIAGFTVTGGTYHGFDSKNSNSENPVANFVATGYTSESDTTLTPVAYTVVLDTTKYETVTTTINEAPKDVQTVTESEGNTITDTFVKATSGEADFAEVAYAIMVETKNTSTSEVSSTVYNPVAAAVTTTSDVDNVDIGKVVTNDATEEKVTAKVTEIKETLTTFTASVAASSEEKSVNILNTTAASNAIAAAAATVADKSDITEVEVQLNTKLEGYTIASTGTVEKVIYNVKPVAVVKNESGAQIGNAVTLTNEDLAEQNLTLTFTLPVPDDLVDATQATPYVKVTHTHENTSVTTALYEVKGSAGGYYIESESGDFSTFTLEKVVLVTTGENALVAYQLTLDGSVGADFYITLNSNVEYYSNAKIRLTPVRVGSGENTQTSTAKEYKVSELTALSGVTINDRPVYKVFFKTYAKELYDKINIELVDAGSEKFTGVIAGHDWLQSNGTYAISVIDLAQYMYNADGVSDNGKKLAKALENFGYYTTKYLNYYTNPAAPAFDAGTIPGYTTPGDGELGAALDASYLTYSGQLLNMSAETGLRMVFEPNSGYTMDDFTFTINRGNGEEILAKGWYDSTRFYVLLPNVASSDLNKVFSITIKCTGADDATFTRSAMNWVNSIHVPGNAGKLNYQFAEALRQYNLAADLYFGN